MAENPDESELVKLVERISCGDRAAEEELVARYKNGVCFMINRIVQNWMVTDDISQDTFIIVLEKIRKREIREPEKLSGFVINVAKFQAIQYIRIARESAKNTK